jgi:hypothetical protein
VQRGTAPDDVRLSREVERRIAALRARTAAAPPSR